MKGSNGVELLAVTRAANSPADNSTPVASVAARGHTDLRVGDLAEAQKLYPDTLAFAVTAEADGALFYAAGGYHHIATNIWGSAGAGDRMELLALRSVTVHVGDIRNLTAVSGRLTEGGVPFTESAGGLTVNDPWGNEIRLQP